MAEGWFGDSWKMTSSSNSIKAHDRTFRRIVRRGFLVPIGLMAAASFLLAALVSHLLTVTDWVDHTDQVIAQAHLCHQILMDMESSVRGFQITGGEPVLEPFQKSQHQIWVELGKLGQMVSDNPDQVQNVMTVRSALTNWLNYAQTMIERRRLGEDVEDLGMNLHGQDLMDAVESHFGELLKGEEVLRQERLGVVHGISRNISRFRLVTLVAFGAVIGLYVRRQLTDVARSYEEVLATAQQKTKELERSEASLKDAENKLRQYAETLEITVEQRTAQLHETITQLKAYSYSVSHDLRAPLRAMHGYAKVLLDDYQATLGTDEKMYLERILLAAERMDNLIQDVLSYSQLASIELKSEPIDLNKLVKDIVQHYPQLSSVAARGGIVIESPLPQVMAPEAALSQCLSNLLTNAAKFVPEGAVPRVVVRAECQDRDVRLWVEDNGIGISAEYQARIFGVFERIPGERSYEGTGIGLAIVRRAAERMGGQVGVESELGKGSKFWVLLPGARI